MSCGEDKTDKIINKLQGDWISITYDNHFISFRDSLCFWPEHYTDFMQYFIKNDTILVPARNIKFNFLRITDKYIWGIENGKEIPLFINTRSYHLSNLKLISLEIRFHYFWQKGLYDWALYIDDNLDCFMKVDSVLQKHRRIKNPLPYPKGLYYTKLSLPEFEFYQDKFRNIPINKIKQEYISDNYSNYSRWMFTDRTAVFLECKYRIEGNNDIKKVNVIVKGFEGAPGILGAFMIHLNKIHSYIKFSETTKTHDFKFYQSEYINYFP
jgi:hypothetical protein